MKDPIRAKAIAQDIIALAAKYGRARRARERIIAALPQQVTGPLDSGQIKTLLYEESTIKTNNDFYVFRDQLLDRCLDLVRALDG